MSGEGETGPAKVLEIFARECLLQQVLDCRGDARVGSRDLAGRAEERRRAGDGLGGPAQDAAVAIVDAAFVGGPVEQQAQAFLDPRIPAVTGAAQSQAGPGGRLGPGEVALRPRPSF